jgi:putative oxidoreductase
MSTIAIVLQILLGLIFLMAGTTKMIGNKMHVDNFVKWGYPQWFRSVTGAVETFGGIGLLIGIWYPGIGGLAGLWLTITMLGALFTHLRIKDKAGATMVPVILMLLSIIVASINWDDLRGLF